MSRHCMCVYPPTCSFTGSVACSGCGGDQCICVCGGGEVECPGCEECPRDDDELLDEEDARP